MAGQDGERGLVARAKQGDADAAAALLTPYLPRLQAWLRARLDPLTAQRESAADLLQSSCREVLADLGRFDDHGEGDGAFRRWLWRTTLRKLRDRQRFHRRDKRDAAQEACADPVQELLRVTATPSRLAAGEEDRRRVIAACAKLPDDYREAVRLLYFEGRTAAEVAERMGRSRVAVHSLMARALARLATLLQD